MLHVSRCKAEGGTEGVSGSNCLPNGSSAGLPGDRRIICPQNEANEKEPGWNDQPVMPTASVFLISAVNHRVIEGSVEGLSHLLFFKGKSHLLIAQTWGLCKTFTQDFSQYL